MSRLLDCFSALLSFGLGLDASIATGRANATCEVARRRARELLDEARASARSVGKPAEQIESALFAMVAWMDEILARHPDCAGDAAPLQLKFFNSNNAHSEFFHHLSALPADQQEVREVYWHALALGFKGQYYFEQDDDGELGKLKELHAQQLAIRPAAIGTLAQDHVTPQPYDTPDPPGPRDPQRRERALLRTGAALALAVPLAYLLSFVLAGPHDETPTLVQRVDQQLQSYACADLSATMTSEGTVHVSGFVSQQEDAARVRRDVSDMPGVGTATFDLQLRIWPHCEVVAILKPYQGRNREFGHGLKVAAVTAHDGHLREGDQVLLEVTNANYDGYLRVDYYTADGSVMHLNSGKGQRRVPAGKTVELGRDIPASWLVAPPFGTVLLTALSSPMPFGDPVDRPPFELASSYLQQLRESLATGERGARLIADFVFLETTPR